MESAYFGRDYELSRVGSVANKGVHSIPDRYRSFWSCRATEPNFDRIVNNLRIVLLERGVSTKVLSELRSNGLGFNNLLYIATVLAELDASKEATLPLLLVEEPEAHLHPQLQTLLADHLARGGTATGGSASRVQTIVTTHSPYLLDLFRDHPEEVIIADKQGQAAHFLRLHPRTLADALTTAQAEALVSRTVRLLRLNARPGTGRRITTGRLAPTENLWVYQRTGRPCRRCGTPIQSWADMPVSRRVYWCASCQPPPPDRHA